MRKIKEEDLEKIMNWRMLPEVTKYMYTDPVLTIEKQKQWFKEITTNRRNFFWIICFNDIDIGVIGITNIDYINRKCTWAWYIGELEYRGIGVGRIIEWNMYEYVFEKLKLNKLCSEVFSFNSKVIELHSKCGSVIEGSLKEHIYKNGSYYDVVAMGITASRWNKIKNSFHYSKIEIEE